MFITRFFVGLASGALLAIGLACQSDSKNADRIFGYWVACQMTVSSVGYLLLPVVRTNWGIDGFLLALILLGSTTFASILFLPNRGLDRTSPNEKRQISLLASMTALFGALLFFMAQGGLWAFLERMGIASNLSLTQIGFALAISSYFGIAGGLAKNWLADALGSLSPFAFVVIGELIMLLLFSATSSYVWFAVAVCLLQFCWAMGMASLLGALNTIDKSGGLVLLLMSTAKVGYSLGPAIMGWLIMTNDYTLVLFTSGLFVVVGILITASLISRTAKRHVAS
jgi:predicted MFS family arabinose efflux permease